MPAPRSLPSVSLRLVATTVASLLVLGLAMAWAVAPVRAASFSVNTIADASDDSNGDGVCDSDPGDAIVCNLRAAIEEANSLDGADVVNVPAGTYDLPNGTLLVAGDLTLTGAGAATTHLVGNGSGSVLELDSDVALTVGISGVTVRNGSQEVGGGIIVGSDVSATVTSSTITENFAAFGAGIYVDDDGHLALGGSVVSQNGGEFLAFQGGGIYVDDSTATLTGTTVRDNAALFGGGIYNSGGALTVEGASIIAGNEAILSKGGGQGGGIYHEEGTVVVSGGSMIGGFSEADANTADDEGGGIWAEANVNVSDSSVTGNVAGDAGGGIYMGGSAHLLSALRSTVSWNSTGDEGGGIWSDGDVELLNSTVSHNQAEGEGGGVLVDGNVRLEFTTVSQNASGTEGGGVWTQGGAEFYASIVAGNTAGDCHHNDTGVTSFGSNIDSDGTCDFDQLTDQPSTNPMLADLGGNGGPTQTHALMSGSPAIDAVQPRIPVDVLGTQGVGTGCEVSVDQRGVARPQDGNDDATAACDIGSFELVLAGEPTPTPTPTPTGTGQPASPTPTPNTGALPDTRSLDGGWRLPGLLGLLSLIVLTVSAVAHRAARSSR
jgi:CSLREA domain-containing protein